MDKYVGWVMTARSYITNPRTHTYLLFLAEIVTLTIAIDRWGGVSERGCQACGPLASEWRQYVRSEHEHARDGDMRLQRIGARSNP